MKNLEPVADRVVEHDQILDVPFVGESARSLRHVDPLVLKPRGKRIERRGVRDLPAEKADTLAAIGLDDNALPTIVHAEGKRGARFVDALQSQQTRAVACPVVQILGADPDITQSLGNTMCAHGNLVGKFPLADLMRLLRSLYAECHRG